MAKIPHLINTFIKIGQNVLTHRAFDGLIADYPIEYGSNSNGNWEKWRSGKLEQWGFGKTEHASINTYYLKNITFPVPFINDSYALTCVGRLNASQGDLGVTNYYKTHFAISSKRNDATYDTVYGYTVIGRWK